MLSKDNSFSSRAQTGWWAMPTTDGDSHVVPSGELHDLSDACACGPRVESVDPATGLLYEHGARVIIHNSQDGREALEEARRLLGL